jgi:hypothetical protein
MLLWLGISICGATPDRLKRVRGGDVFESSIPAEKTATGKFTAVTTHPETTRSLKLLLSISTPFDNAGSVQGKAIKHRPVGYISTE